MLSRPSALEPVLKTALLGTGRDTSALQLDGPLQAFGVAQESAAMTLLNAATALTFYQQAGTLPVQSQTPLIAPCPPETQPYFSRQAATLLESCLSGYRALLPQALGWAAQSGQIAPPSLLPQLLEVGRGSKELRGPITTVVGERGRWLAQLNPDWKHVTAPLQLDLEASWRDGGTTERRQVLQLQRELEPAVARSWIEAEFKTAGAKERAEWLGILATDLSDADEPFLESALDDKSKEVCQMAIGLLQKLPHSRLIQRAQATLKPLLAWNAKNKSLTVELPTAWRPEWARDGLEEKLEIYGQEKQLGKRASWFSQLMARVPPGYWVTRFGVRPATIIAGVPEDWRSLLETAWWDAALLHGAVEWSLALLAPYNLASIHNYFRFQDLPPATADALALALLEHKGATLTSNSPLTTLLSAHPGPFSVPLARHFLREMQEFIRRWQQPNPKSQNYSYNWLRYALPDLADKLPTEIITEVPQGWLRAEELEHHWAPIATQHILPNVADQMPSETITKAIQGQPTTEELWQYWGPVVTQFLTRWQLRADLKAAFGNPTL